MAKATEGHGSDAGDPALDSSDRTGLRSELPYRLERLREPYPSEVNPRSEPPPKAIAEAPSRQADVTSDGAGRPLANVVDTHVGARIRLRRRRLGLSQAKLAHAAGIALRQLQAYERGLDRIPAGRLRDLGRTLGTSISYFFGDLAAEPGEPSARPLGNGHSAELRDAQADRLHARDTLSLMEAHYSLEDPEVLRQLLELVASLGHKH